MSTGGNQTSSDVDTNEDWSAADEPMTAAQRLYIDTLASHAGEPSPPESMTKIEATRRIKELEKEAELTNAESRELDLEDDPSLGSEPIAS